MTIANVNVHSVQTSAADASSTQDTEELQMAGVKVSVSDEAVGAESPVNKLIMDAVDKLFNTVKQMSSDGQLKLLEKIIEAGGKSLPGEMIDEAEKFLKLGRHSKHGNIVEHDKLKAQLEKVLPKSLAEAASEVLKSAAPHTQAAAQQLSNHVNNFTQAVAAHVQDAGGLGSNYAGGSASSGVGSSYSGGIGDSAGVGRLSIGGASEAGNVMLIVMLVLLDAHTSTTHSLDIITGEVSRSTATTDEINALMAAMTAIQTQESATSGGNFAALVTAASANPATPASLAAAAAVQTALQDLADNPSVSGLAMPGGKTGETIGSWATGEIKDLNPPQPAPSAGLPTDFPSVVSAVIADVKLKAGIAGGTVISPITADLTNADITAVLDQGKKASSSISDLTQRQTVLAQTLLTNLQALLTAAHSVVSVFGTTMSTLSNFQ